MGYGAVGDSLPLLFFGKRVYEDSVNLRKIGKGYGKMWDGIFFALCFTMFFYGLAMANGRKIMGSVKHRLFVYDDGTYVGLTWAKDKGGAIEKFARVYGEIDPKNVYPAFYNPFKVAVIR